MQKVSVNTNTTNYPIYVEGGLFSNEKFITTELRSKLVGKRVCIITNATVRNLYGKLVEGFFEGLDWTALYNKEVAAPCVPSQLKSGGPKNGEGGDGDGEGRVDRAEERVSVLVGCGAERSGEEDRAPSGNGGRRTERVQDVGLLRCNTRAVAAWVSQ